MERRTPTVEETRKASQPVPDDFLRNVIIVAIAYVIFTGLNIVFTVIMNFMSGMCT